jgi:hypothetical protein
MFNKEVQTTSYAAAMQLGIDIDGYRRGPLIRRVPSELVGVGVADNHIVESANEPREQI